MIGLGLTVVEEEEDIPAVDGTRVMVFALDFDAVHTLLPSLSVAGCELLIFLAPFRSAVGWDEEAGVEAIEGVVRFEGEGEARAAHLG